MITTAGNLHIARYLQGIVPNIGSAIAFGIGTNPASVNDVGLGFEIGRVPVDVLAYDHERDLLIFKGEVGQDFAGRITEIGLFSREDNVGDSMIITTFDSSAEAWFDGGSPATFTSDNVLVGEDAVVLAPSASGSKSVTYDGVVFDFSEYSGSDIFRLALSASNGNVSSVSLRFYTDEANYYTLSTSTVASGFNVLSVFKGAAVATGTPTWSNITRVVVTVNAKASGGTSVTLEGIRLEDNDNVDEGYVLVARTVLTEPFIKAPGSRQDVEFPLGVGISSV